MPRRGRRPVEPLPSTFARSRPQAPFGSSAALSRAPARRVWCKNQTFSLSPPANPTLHSRLHVENHPQGPPTLSPSRISHFLLLSRALAQNVKKPVLGRLCPQCRPATESGPRPPKMASPPALPGRGSGPSPRGTRRAAMAPLLGLSDLLWTPRCCLGCLNNHGCVVVQEPSEGLRPWPSAERGTEDPGPNPVPPAGAGVRPWTWWWARVSSFPTLCTYVLTCQTYLAALGMGNIVRLLACMRFFAGPRFAHD